VAKDFDPELFGVHSQNPEIVSTWSTLYLKTPQSPHPRSPQCGQGDSTQIWRSTNKSRSVAPKLASGLARTHALRQFPYLAFEPNFPHGRNRSNQHIPSHLRAFYRLKWIGFEWVRTRPKLAFEMAFDFGRLT
jgi:hypothetical protein